MSFFVAGTPKPAGSKRGFAIKKGGAYTGRVIVTDACKTSRDWKTDVQIAAHALTGGDAPDPWTGPLYLTLEFFVARPKGHFRTGKNAGVLREGAPEFPTGRPDVLKLARGVEDALSSILYLDDAQIVTERLTKRYGRPGVQIGLREAEIVSTMTTPPQKPPDARLIAAAPELLAALQRLYDNDELTCGLAQHELPAGECPCSGCQARAAIAKATADLTGRHGEFTAGRDRVCQCIVRKHLPEDADVLVIDYVTPEGEKVGWAYIGRSDFRPEPEPSGSRGDEQS